MSREPEDMDAGREDEAGRGEPPPQFEGDAEGLGEARLTERLVGVFRNPKVRQRVIAPMSFDAAILITNLATGIIVARALGPSGRGELAATLLVAQIAAWLFSMGSSEAISYFQARRPQDGPRLLSSWLLVTVPLALIGIALTELLLPVVFAAQTDTAIDLARIYLLVIPIIAFQQIFSGMLLGDHDFFYYNVTRFLYPALAAAVYAACLLFDAFSVEAALIANGAAMGVALVISAYRSLRRHGLGRPDRALLRHTFKYGVKAHAGSTAGLVNARLDLIVIPAFLTAASVGLYSIATNVTSIITTLTGTVALMALPIAAREQGAPRPILITLQTAMGISLVLAIPLAVLAPVLLGLVYGSDFESAATALRLLLPGAVLAAGVNVLVAGLLAANRPLTVSAASGLAAALTIGGLIVFLPIGGITAAAIVTSVVYVVEFSLMAELYRRAVGIRWIHFFRVPAA
jgi:O-antigen/teichoic acid export membrane protein